MDRKRISKILIAVIFTFSGTDLAIAQKDRDIIGSWVRVGQGVGLAAEIALTRVNNADYLKLEFKNNRKLNLYGSYLANGIETNYKLKKGNLTFGFDRAYQVESHNDSSLVLIELEKGKAKEDLVRHYYLKEQLFLDRIGIGEGDWFINGMDTVYFASKKLYPRFQTSKYPDFHLYVHNAAKESYNDGPNYMFASFSIEPDGLVNDVEVWHHVNEEADAKVIAAIQNSSNRWVMPLSNEKTVTVRMHMDDSYVKRDVVNHAEVALSPNEVFANSADTYRNGILIIARLFKRKKYEEALKYIANCELIAPDEPNLLYLRYKVYLAMNNEAEVPKVLSDLKQSRLSYLVR